MSFVHPEFLYLLFLLPFLLWVYRKSLVEARVLFKRISFLLTFLALVFLILALAKPFLKENSDAVHLNVLIDVSKSIEFSDVFSKLEEIKRTIHQLGGEDSYQIFVFGKSLKYVPFDELEKTIEEYFSPNNKEEVFCSESDLESAVRSARMFYPSGKIKKMLLLSDGRQTNGSFENTKDFFAKENILVQAIALKTKEKDEVFVYQFQPSSDTAYEGERVRLKATLAMNYSGQVKAKFIYDGIVDKEYEVTIKANEKYDLYHDIIVRKSGMNLWKVEVSAPKDYFLINNELSCFIDVKGKPRVLAIHQREEKLRSFKKVMEAQNIHLDVRGKFGVPDSLSKLLEYDALVLADIPATMLTERQMSQIKKYVTDYGGGLIMMGSENSFGLGGYYRTPVEDVLPIVSRYEKEKEKPSLALMLVIDKSGSMEGIPIQLAKQAAKAAVDLLGNQDYGGVIAFDTQPFVVSELQSMHSRGSVLDSIDLISASGGTDMLPAMVRAKEMLEGSTAKIKHMIVLGDGQTDPAGLLELAGEMSLSRITISVVSLGDAADRVLFKGIADRGNGRYYETNDPSTVPQIFVKETVEASKSAIKEVPFVPIKVGQHEMLEGIDFSAAPYLVGYVMTKMKPTAQMQLLTEEGDPLLALGQYGLGKGLAFTSDVTEQWAFEWLDWSEFGKFWGQVIRSCLRRENKEGLQIRKAESSHQLHMKLTQKDELGNLQPNQNWTGIVSNQNGMSEKIAIESVGYGVYQTKFPMEEQGLYSLKLVNTDYGKSVTTYYQKNYPKEYQLGSPVSHYFEKLLGYSLDHKVTLAYRYRDMSVFFILSALGMLILAIVFRRI